MKWIIVILTLFLIGVVYLWKNQVDFAIVRNGAEIIDDQKDQKTKEALPFEELTIPYLAKRAYDSDLGEKKLYQSKPTYNSYITSYISDGLKINGLLTIPKGEVPAGGWSAVVFVHGYIPPTTYKTTEKYIEYVDYLARNGLVVFKIDLRGHGEVLWFPQYGQSQRRKIV